MGKSANDQSTCSLPTERLQITSIQSRPFSCRVYPHYTLRTSTLLVWRVSSPVIVVEFGNPKETERQKVKERDSDKNMYCTFGFNSRHPFSLQTTRLK